MDRRHDFEKHCLTCTQRWSSQCQSAGYQYIHTLTNCPLDKWWPQETKCNSSGTKPILWISQDFAQGGITSFITYAAPILAESNTPILAILHESDFKFDTYRADIVQRYCPLYRMGSEPQSIYDEAGIVTFSYVYSDSIQEHVKQRLSKKTYNKVIYQAHGDCQFTRASIRNQKAISDAMSYERRIGFAPTKFSQSMLSEETGLPIDDVYRMYYGVEQEKYTLRNNRLFFANTSQFYSPQPFRFLCLGRLDPHKQFDVSARMVNDFRKSHSTYAPYANARMTLIGDGWAKEQVLKSLQPYRHFIDYLPWVDTPEVVEQIKAHDMLLMHSLSEGGPIVTIEALSCGLPVHSTCVGIWEDLIEIDPNHLLFSTTTIDPTLTTFVKRLNSPQSITERPALLNRIKYQYSKATLFFDK